MFNLSDSSSPFSARGIDDLLFEYVMGADAGRRARLDAFFSACLPGHTPGSVAMPVKLGYQADLRALGRAEVIVPRSAHVIDVVGEIVHDQDVDLIDLRDAIILSDQTAILENLYITEQIKHMSGNWLQSGEGFTLNIHDLNRQNCTASVDIPQSITHLPDEDIHFLFQAYVGNVSFGHFIFDALLQLIAYDHLKKTKGRAIVPIVISNLPQPFHYSEMTWLFEKLVGPVSQVVQVRSGTAVQARHAYTSNRIIHLGAGGLSFKSVEYLRDRIAAECGPSDSIGPKRIYISRRDVGTRNPENLDEVEALLAARGFETLMITGMTPQDVYEKFNDVEIIVGGHGSGLMKHVYARRPIKLIEITLRGFDWNPILATAAASGHTVFRVPADENGADLDMLIAALDAP